MTMTLADIVDRLAAVDHELARLEALRALAQKECRQQRGNSTNGGDRPGKEDKKRFAGPAEGPWRRLTVDRLTSRWCRTIFF
jgi:hypothetical protein